MTTNKTISIKKSSILIVAIVCAAGLIFTACAQKEQAKTESVIVLGNHMNTRPIDIKNNKLIDNALDSLCRTGGKLSVIVADGKPFLAASYEVDAPKDGVSDKVVEKHVNSNKAALKEAMLSSNPYAKVEETDPLNALKLAGRIFASKDSNANKELLFVHTGLATTGTLRDNLTANPVDIVKYLEDQKISMTFDGVSVVMTHIGEVADKQNPLTDAQLVNVENIYKGILENGGAKVSIDRGVEPFSESKERDLPNVSVVSFPESEIADLAGGENAILDDSTLTFYPNKAELIDPANAREVVRPYVDQIKKNDLTVVVLGLTAKVGTRESSLSLSGDRAKTIASLLEDEGIPASSIKIIGGGFDTSFYIRDTDKSGNLILSEATKNRRVILLNGGTETAKKIVAKHG